MYTKTAKLILSPLAEAVTQLILIISESEIKKTPLPDLSALAKIVNEQINNLVAIGTKIGHQANADEMLRTNMPIACVEVTNASKLLVVGATDLLIDTKSSEGKNKLLSAASGILSGTTSVLNTFDDFEVRKIVKACQAVQEKGKIISHDESILNPQNLVQTIMITSQFIVALNQLTNKRVTELLSLNHQNRLKDAIQTISRESPVLISALKVILQNPSNTACTAAKNLSCSRINDACSEIVKVVQIRGELESSEISLLSKSSFQVRLQLLDDARHKVSNYIVAEESTDLVQSTHEYDQHAGNLLKSAQDLVGELVKSRDASDALALTTKLQLLTSHIAKANSVQSDLIDNQEDFDTKANTLTTLTNASRAFKKFRDDVDNEIIADFMDAVSAVSDAKSEFTPLGRAIKIADSGNTKLTEEAKQSFIVQCQQIDGLLVHVANRVAPQSEKCGNEILLKQKKLRELLPGLLSAIDIRAASNGDPSSKELLNTIVTMWEGDVKDIQGLVFNAFDGSVVVVGTELAASRILRKLGNLRDPKDAQDAVVSLDKLKKQYSLFLGKEIENTSDPAYKVVLQSNIHRLEEALPVHLVHMQSILTSGDFDPTKLSFEVQKLTDVLSSIGTSIKRPGQDIVTAASEPKHYLLPELPTLIVEDMEGLKITRVASDESITREKAHELRILSRKQSEVPGHESQEVASPDMNYFDALESCDALDTVLMTKPVLFTAEEAEASPIAAAAREIVVEASKWSRKGNKIVEKVSFVAESMTSLSEFHNALKNKPTAENKAGFITASLGILGEVNALQALSKDLVEKCTDMRLRKQLSDTMDQITTTAQQLKIVAAVKASSPKDTDKDQQLITCAQNLVKVVKACMRECESSSLRQGSVSVSVDTMPPKILFKRQVYKRLNLK